MLLTCLQISLFPDRAADGYCYRSLQVAEIGQCIGTSSCSTGIPCDSCSSAFAAYNSLDLHPSGFALSSLHCPQTFDIQVSMLTLLDAALLGEAQDTSFTSWLHCILNLQSLLPQLAALFPCLCLFCPSCCIDVVQRQRRQLRQSQQLLFLVSVTFALVALSNAVTMQAAQAEIAAQMRQAEQLSPADNRRLERQQVSPLSERTCLLSCSIHTIEDSTKMVGDSKLLQCIPSWTC